jgi:hypothetical protein
MRLIFVLSLILTIVFATSNWYVRTANICPVPINYRIGVFDERFGISKESALSVLSEAEAVWEKTVGRELFQYDESAKFTVNFIYDERQQLVTTEEAWRNLLDVKEGRSQAALESVRQKIADYEVENTRYQTLRDSYEERLKAYNERVAIWNQNQSGGEEEFRLLQEAEEELDADLRNLLSLEGVLKTKANEINLQNQEANRLVEEYNAEVVKYNAVYGQTRQFTQGEFSRDEINVYKFSDETELTKVLAHEFGHALGVGHVEDSQAIMYYLMEEQPDLITLTSADTAAFVETCGQGGELSHAMRRIIRTTLANIL